MEILFVIAIAAAFLGGPTLVRRMIEKRDVRERAKEVTEAAERINFTFESEANVAPTRIQHFHLLSQGPGDISISNVISGKFQDIDTILFDYHFVISGASGTLYGTQTVVAMLPVAAELPEFTMRQHAFPGRFWNENVYYQVQITGNDKFRETYELRAVDTQQVKQYMSQERMRKLEQYLDFAVESKSNQLLFYTPGHTVRAEAFKRHLQQCYELMRLLTEN